MNIFKTESSTTDLRVAVEDSELGAEVKLFIGDKLTNSFRLDRDTVRQAIGARGFVEGTHLYVFVDSGTGALTGIANKLAETLLDKRPGQAYSAFRRDIVVAQLYIPFPDSPLSDWTLRVNCNPKMENSFPAGTLSTGSTPDELHDFAVAVHPGVRVVSVEALSDGATSITLQLMHKGQDVSREGARIFVRHDAGYVSRSEVYTNSAGVATVKARRLDLGPGESMTVEFGFKFMTNVVSVDV